MDYSVAARILLLGMLGFFAFQDLKTRKIWWPLAAFMLAAGIFMNHPMWAVDWRAAALALLPGILLGLCALLPSHPVGAGDGFAVAACGACMPGGVLELLMIAFLMCAFWAACLLIFHRAGRKDRLPFLPFLFAAHICLCVYEGLAAGPG